MALSSNYLAEWNDLKKLYQSINLERLRWGLEEGTVEEDAKISASTIEQITYLLKDLSGQSSSLNTIIGDILSTLPVAGEKINTTHINSVKDKNAKVYRTPGDSCSFGCTTFFTSHNAGFDSSHTFCSGFNAAPFNSSHSRGRICGTFSDYGSVDNSFSTGRCGFDSFFSSHFSSNFSTNYSGFGRTGYHYASADNSYTTCSGPYFSSDRNFGYQGNCSFDTIFTFYGRFGSVTHSVFGHCTEFTSVHSGTLSNPRTGGGSTFSSHDGSFFSNHDSGFFRCNSNFSSHFSSQFSGFNGTHRTGTNFTAFNTGVTIRCTSDFAAGFNGSFNLAGFCNSFVNEFI